MDDKELEKKDWKFDGEAPMLENEIKLDGEFEVEIPENESKDEFETNSKKSKKHKPINKKALKISLISIFSVIAVAIITTVCVCFFAVPNANEKMTPGNTAMVVGNTKVSVGMYNYYYAGVVAQYVENAQYGRNNIDPTEDYATQYTTDENGNEISWLEVFKKDTVSQIQYNVAYYEKALEEGITLTEQQKTQIDEQIKNIESSAADADMSVGAFLKQNAGEYCGVATIRKALEQSAIGRTYNVYLTADNKYDETEVEKYLGENKKEYSLCKFAGLEIMGNGVDEKSIADLKARAEKYSAQVKDVASLKALIPEACAELINEYINSYGYFENEEEAIEGLKKTAEMQISYPQLKEQFSDEIADWLVSDDGIGETKYFVNEKYGFAYVFYKTGTPVYSETEYFSVRHILVLPHSADEADNAEGTEAENPADKKYTDEEWNVALEKANKILEEYKSGEQTEMAFAFLAEEKSEDVQSTTGGTYGLFGGAIERIGLGEMVPEFEKWATDKSRKYGDVGIVKSQFGYHIMFYIYSGPEYRFNAIYDLKAEKIAELEKEFAKEYTVNEKNAIKKVQTAKPFPKDETKSDAENANDGN